MTYWEGSIIARGTRGVPGALGTGNGNNVQGRGYLEMTGYAGPLQPGLYSPE